jgi:hypothetical protein
VRNWPGILSSIACGLTLAAGIGCAEPTSEATASPTAIVAEARIPPLEVQVETPPPVAEVELAVAAKAGIERPSVQSVARLEPPTTVVETAPPPTATYEPPFPDRTDLFVPPKRAGGAAATQGAGESAVTLLGFIRVDQPKAVLSINGEVLPLAAGESRYGVDVISINVPNVVLQRGRQRWQATLE